MLNNEFVDIFPNYPPILNAKMIAEILDLGYIKALKIIKFGGINYVKLGNTYRVPKIHFIKWLYDNKPKEIIFEE